MVQDLKSVDPKLRMGALERVKARLDLQLFDGDDLDLVMLEMQRIVPRDSFPACVSQGIQCVATAAKAYKKRFSWHATVFIPMLVGMMKGSYVTESTEALSAILQYSTSLVRDSECLTLAFVNMHLLQQNLKLSDLGHLARSHVFPRDLTLHLKQSSTRAPILRSPIFCNYKHSLSDAAEIPCSIHLFSNFVDVAACP